MQGKLLVQGKWEIKAICVIFIMTIIFSLVACSNDVNKETNARIFDKKIEKLEVEISTNSNSEIVIPNPEKCMETVPKIQLYRKEKKLNENCEKRSEYDDTGEMPKTDLSYLGINEPVYITNFSIGHMGKENVEDIDVVFEVAENNEKLEKTVKGNCLVLTFNKKKSDDDAIDRAYLAVLDYTNRKNYLIQTGLATSTLSKLNLCDFTGDGTDEIIVSGVANKWIEWQVFKLTDNNMTEIRSDFYEDDEYSSTNYISNAFVSKVISPTKIKITCKNKKFEKIVSVDKFVDNRGLEDEDVDICGEIGEIYGYDYFDNVDSKTGICINLDIVLYNEEVCGKINVYLKYCPENEKICISDIKFRQ